MAASLGRPHKVHSFRDPEVGDLLEIVTAYPPARRGAVRDLSYRRLRPRCVPCMAFVIRPVNERLDIALSKDLAVITAPEGLTLSIQENKRAIDSGNASNIATATSISWPSQQDNPAVLVKPSARSLASRRRTR